ncbi:Cytochrome c oxidase subunit 8A, mitochondrial [Lodderomyces elongisporus]|uniref:Uncharacterized protein n=1 Tax=Lodderomyces elongisporus (strain ATCC 11503 / CBS 2605 / JCM 1781 / NBRC 1676 / NRRL YB-4239) TaxID=379508 RepID=A5DUE3_LODEL|nr:Cytochrome c oxidase subunit 8A, mitochondrial [Lodderomyces elongisporus]EDK42801.1 predicted protein [Lodderomyces elongisporus NRRL YB-4239]WLF77232.1 Cytochrome c oxidase subunit 8A, mitochondrial [Lodderomyces elongisporus]
MLSRSLLQRSSKATMSPAKQLTQLLMPKRSFQQSLRTLNKELPAMDHIYGTPKEGVYSNLPFQVKDRKFIPFSVWYWGVLGFFFFFPFMSSGWQMYKAGVWNPFAKSS